MRKEAGRQASQAKLSSQRWMHLAALKYLQVSLHAAKPILRGGTARRQRDCSGGQHACMWCNQHPPPCARLSKGAHTPTYSVSLTLLAAQWARKGACRQMGQTLGAGIGSGNGTDSHRGHLSLGTSGFKVWLRDGRGVETAPWSSAQETRGGGRAWRAIGCMSV